MKILLIAVLILSLSYASNLRNLSTPRDDCVIFYQHQNYEGDSVEKCNSIEEVGKKWKNRYSSVKLGANVEYIIVYPTKQFQGTSAIYTTDMADLGDLNDDIQSFTISTYISDNCVRLWEREHLKGDNWTVCESKSSINSSRQDKYTYIQYGNGVHNVFFYTFTYYENKSNTSTEYTTKNTVIDSSFRSFTILHETLPDDYVWLFGQQYYSGSYIELCNWTTDIGTMKQKIESIWLGNSIDSITVYDEIDYNGSSQTYSSNKSTLGTWKDRIQSIKI